MPILNDDELRPFLADGRIAAITVDTNIFDEKALQLNSPTLQAIAGLKEKPFDFILSGTVAQEIRGHLQKTTESALNSAKKAIGQALFAFETEEPKRDHLIEQMSGGRTASEAAQQRFQKYVADTGCEVLDDATLVNVSTIFDGYFAGTPPFGLGKKKSEFPDSLALNALERIAVDRGVGILVVSKDGDWSAFCEKSKRLYLMPEIERALDLVNNAPLGLRKSIYSWIEGNGEGHDEVRSLIQSKVEWIEFSANGYPTSGELEASTWAGELKDLSWPEASDVDIIDTDNLDDGTAIRVTVSLPLTLFILVPVELSFSVWDSVDKESLGMGGRMIEFDEKLEVRATITLDIHGQGTDDEEMQLIDGELDIKYHEIELGELDIFEPRHY